MLSDKTLQGHHRIIKAGFPRDLGHVFDLLLGIAKGAVDGGVLIRRCTVVGRWDLRWHVSSRFLFDGHISLTGSAVAMVSTLGGWPSAAEVVFCSTVMVTSRERAT